MYIEILNNELKIFLNNISKKYQKNKNRYRYCNYSKRKLFVPTQITTINICNTYYVLLDSTYLLDKQ